MCINIFHNILTINTNFKMLLHIYLNDTKRIELTQVVTQVNYYPLTKTTTVIVEISTKK